MSLFKEAGSKIILNFDTVVRDYVIRTFTSEEDEILNILSSPYLLTEINSQPPRILPLNSWLNPLRPYSHYLIPANHVFEILISIPSMIFSPILDTLRFTYHLTAMIVFAVVDTSLLLMHSVKSLFSGKSVAHDVIRLVDHLSYYSLSMCVDLLDIAVSLLKPFVLIPTLATRSLATVVEKVTGESESTDNDSSVTIYKIS